MDVGDISDSKYARIKSIGDYYYVPWFIKAVVDTGCGYKVRSREDLDEICEDVFRKSQKERDSMNRANSISEEKLYNILCRDLRRSKWVIKNPTIGGELIC